MARHLITDNARLSRLLFAAREQIAMWAEVVEKRAGRPATDVRQVLDEIDAYRAERGWSAHGFGGERSGEIVAITVPQLNNGVPTLVVFAVPAAALIPGVELDFDQANALSLGPPLVLTKHDFTA
jgi:hypothetical protein